MVFLRFAKDLMIEGIGFMIVPWAAIAWLAFQLYTALKLNNGVDDYGLGWPLIVLALVFTAGHYLFGARFHRIYDRHFGDNS
jgi:hypothetical protein